VVMDRFLYDRSRPKTDQCYTAGGPDRFDCTHAHIVTFYTIGYLLYFDATNIPEVQLLRRFSICYWQKTKTTPTYDMLYIRIQNKLLYCGCHNFVLAL
jgi:hypothetical protein